MSKLHLKSNIYIFGNLLVKEDSLILKLLPKLEKRFPKINFLVVDTNEDFPPKGEKNLIILDTVLGIKEPMVLSLDDFEKKKKTPISPHDYDLLFHLLLLKKMKKLNKVTIIGLPYELLESQINNSLRFVIDKIQSFERLYCSSFNADEL